MEIYVKNLKIGFDFEFQGQNFCFTKTCILLITKVKLFQGITGRNLIVLLKNGKTVS